MLFVYSRFFYRVVVEFKRDSRFKNVVYSRCLGDDGCCCIVDKVVMLVALLFIIEMFFY